MKKIIIGFLAIASLSTMAAKYERDFVKVKDYSAQGVYQKALDMAEYIEGARRERRLPMLRNCNWTGSQAEDKHFFRRNAWVNSNEVTFNHVTGEYTATVRVRCRK